MHEQTERAERIVDRRTNRDARENLRRAPRQSDARDERIENDPECDHAGDRLTEHFAELQCAEQRDADAADRSEQSGLRDDAPDAVADEGHRDLEDADEHHRRHSDLPRERCGVGDGHARLRRDERRPEHGECHPDRRWRVETERHRGDVRSPRPFGEPEREPGVREVADHHAKRSAREHPPEHDVGREAERADENAGEDREVDDVVEDEPEERVDVTGRRPAIGA